MATNNVLRNQPVDLIGLKETVKKLLPAESQLRHLVLSQPDTLPWSEVGPKLEILVQILYSELKRTNTAVIIGGALRQEAKRGTRPDGERAVGLTLNPEA